MEKYFRKIYFKDWADTFVSVCGDNGAARGKILVYTDNTLDLYADDYVLDGEDLSDTQKPGIHTHPPATRDQLLSAAADPHIKKIILLFWEGNHKVELVRNTKGDIICVYESEEELGIALGIAGESGDNGDSK